jgi:pSer/pThr/pTyr-binding forkhead associated (FHA) protein
MSGSGLTVVVDHLAGARRGERQTLLADHRLRFGRHPDCEVAFDAHRDIDASSRHAELRPDERGWMLVDLGSSNGTFVGGQRVTEARVTTDRPVEIEFGAGGPRVRLFVGDALAAAALPPPAEARRRPHWMWYVLGVVVAGLGVAAAVMSTGG